MQRPASSERGFTITELMVTLAVVAVLAALAAPSLTQFIRSTRMGVAANQFQGDLQLARREAIKRNGRVIVCPVSSTPGVCGTDFTKWATGWLVCYDIDENDACDNAGDPLVVRNSIDTSLALTGPTALVKFNSDGSASMAGSSLTFTVQGTWSGTKSYTGSVFATGHILMNKPA